MRCGPARLPRVVFGRISPTCYHWSLQPTSENFHATSFHVTQPQHGCPPSLSARVHCPGQWIPGGERQRRLKERQVPRGDGRLSQDLDPGRPGPQDACGVFGVWAPGEEVAKLTYFGLYALQHRGQESAGIAVSNGSQILVFKDMGLVSQVFDETSLGSLQGHIAVGHARYSTTGASVWENAQPTFRATAQGSIALGHNGNLVNTAQLAEMVAD